VALIGGAGCHHDHLALGLAQAAVLLHQRVMVSEEGAELVRPVRQHQKDVGNEAGLFLYREQSLADIVGHRRQRRHRKSADGRRGHGRFLGRMMSSE
jgi:hypothetical protein